VNSNFSAYIFWEDVQDRATNNNNNEKLILIYDQDYQVSKRHWAFAQLRIIQLGAMRVGASGVCESQVLCFCECEWECRGRIYQFCYELTAYGCCAERVSRWKGLVHRQYP